MKRLVLAITAFAALSLAAAHLELTLEPGELWWGGATADGLRMPYGKTDRKLDLRFDNHTNQTSPMLVSNHGRWLWCDDPIVYEFKAGKLTVDSDGGKEIENSRAGETLRSAYLALMAKKFPPKGVVPEKLLFSAPQYNTWIELNYHQSQQGVLDYAHGIAANGFPAGVIMVDDTWQTDYGVWKFDASAFADPKAMCDELHAMGFKISLWVTPFVSMDSREYRALEKKGAFCSVDKDPVAIRWWNGKSAALDLTNPVAVDWLKSEFDYLQNTYGVDGFKLDAADVLFYRRGWDYFRKGSEPVDQCEAYSRFGENYSLNEMRASWKCGGAGLVQRLNDKACTWKDLSQLMPDMISAGLLGHLFVCPDMIGGGLLGSFKPGAKIDEELFVRSAQVHALSPMMQFSAAPWRVLDEEHFAAIKKVLAVREKFTGYILAEAENSAKTGEPMLRSMEYSFPGNGFAEIMDQFTLGADLIVAPQIARGAKTREVALPPGEWIDDRGASHVGPARLTVETPIDRLVYFRRAE